jgi:hypothetical protein
VCVIVISNGEKIPRDDLEKMWNANPHGCGFAYIEEQKVKVLKGFMDFEDFVTLYELIPNTPHVVHFRYKTHGSISPSLTHPFPLDKIIPNDVLEFETESAFFHNGAIEYHKSLLYTIFPNLSEEEKEIILEYPDLSDSLVMAVYLKVVKNLDFLKFFSGSRFTIVTPKKIIKYGEFVKEGNFEYSNIAWRSRSLYTDKPCPYRKHREKCPTKSYRNCPYFDNRCPYNNTTYNYQNGWYVI